MNKSFLSLYFGILIMLSTTGCSSDSQIVDKDIAKNTSGSMASIEATVPIKVKEHETSGILASGLTNSKENYKRILMEGSNG